MDTNNMSFDEFIKKKVELFESHKYPITVRLTKYYINMMVRTKFRKEHRGIFLLDTFGRSRLSLVNLRKIYGQNLENYETEKVRDGVFINQENPSNVPFLVVREKIQLNKRVFNVDFCIEDDTNNPYFNDCFDTLGADFFIQNKAVIDYESKRLWLDDYKTML